jgi:hypothetical protein
MILVVVIAPRRGYSDEGRFPLFASQTNPENPKAMIPPPNNSSPNGAASRLDFGLHYDAWGRLVVTDAHGRQHVGAETVRAFPLSDPRRGVAVVDAAGREVAWVDDLDALPAPLRRFLEDDLVRRHFVPTIRRILAVSGSGEPAEWEVETDRGSTRFSLKSEEDVRRLPGHGALIADAHGVRYAIPDSRVLDAASRRILEHYL